MEKRGSSDIGCNTFLISASSQPNKMGKKSDHISSLISVVTVRFWMRDKLKAFSTSTL